MSSVLISLGVIPALKKKWGNDTYFRFESKVGNNIVAQHPDVSPFPYLFYDRIYDLNYVHEMRPLENWLWSYAKACNIHPADCVPFVPDSGTIYKDEYIVVHSRKPMAEFLGQHWGKYDQINFPLPVKCVGKSKNDLLIGEDCRDIPLKEMYSIVKQAKCFVGDASFGWNVAQVFNVPSVAFFGSILPETRMINDLTIPVSRNLACVGCHHFQRRPALYLAHCKRGNENPSEFEACLGVSAKEFESKIEQVLSK
ncbi:MAG: hypothetical protein K2X29_05535 [Candidatus Obscuribacterales bacterium]|nr:hypothetical protein [Candidatus Obscuribacterales bacterium]